MQVRMVEYSYRKTIVKSGNNTFAASTVGVFLSTDNERTWTKVNNGLTDTSVSSVAVSGSNIFAGTNHGVFKSANNGSSWTVVIKGLPYILQMHTISIIGSKIFTSFTNGDYFSEVFSSTIGEFRWTSSSKGLEEGFSSIHVNEFTSVGDILFAGTSKGV